MRHHHRGSGRAVVIPDDWAAVHGRVAEGLMTQATVSLGKRGGSGRHFDPDTGPAGQTVDDTPFAPFATDVPARILALTQVRVPPDEAVDDQVRVIGYRISIARSVSHADLKPGSIVKVLTCAGDAMLVGRQLEVSDVVRGTHLFERDLICTLND